MFKLKGVDRYFNNEGKVGVLVSGGFGAGYSTWNDDDLKEFLIFDKTNVELVIKGDYEGLKKRLEALSSSLGEYISYHGVDDLSVEFLPKGAAFKIREYDGNERIELLDEIDWNVA